MARPMPLKLWAWSERSSGRWQQWSRHRGSVVLSEKRPSAFELAVQRVPSPAQFVEAVLATHAWVIPQDRQARELGTPGRAAEFSPPPLSAE
jgi:hypothetical protein